MNKKNRKKEPKKNFKKQIDEDTHTFIHTEMP